MPNLLLSDLFIYTPQAVLLKIELVFHREAENNLYTKWTKRHINLS
jgi:hypothetical protein